MYASTTPGLSEPSEEAALKARKPFFALRDFYSCAKLLAALHHTPAPHVHSQRVRERGRILGFIQQLQHKCALLSRPQAR